MKFYKITLTLSACLLLYFTPQQAFSDDLQKANKYYEQYDYKYAIDLYEKIIQKKPGLEVAEKLANCYRFVNNTEKAQLAYARVLSYPQADPVNYKYFADALKQNGNFNDARVNYLKYAALVPEKSADANKMAVACDFAKNMSENPNKNVFLSNESPLNSEYSDFSPVKYGESYVFVSDRDAGSKDNEISGWTGNPYLKLFEADYRQKNPSINRLSEEINNQYHNGPAVFTTDGNGVYFSRTDVNRDKKTKGIKVGSKQIYYSAKIDGNWGTAQILPFNKDGKYSVQHPALSADGSTLYFASNMPGGFGGMDIYSSRKLENGEWSEAVNCGSVINTSEDEVFPSVNSEGKFYFSSKGHQGMGGLDLFSAKGSNNSFTEITNLASPMNSSKDDFGVLFFNADSGFVSSNRNGGKGLDDIYRFSGMNYMKPVPVFVLNGSVTEESNGMPVSGAEILLHNKLTGADSILKSDASGKFQFSLKEKSEYLVKVDDTRFLLIPEKHISTGSESSVQDANFLVNRIEFVKLNNIYYNFNKWNLRRDAYSELNKLNEFLRTNSAINIQLNSHTDARGSAAYNQWLSQKRAQSVVNYLIKLGVSPQRLKAAGFGETQLLNKCADGINCTEAEHQLNRRTEFNVKK
ncbi:OmpA family protein [Daejeonella oryzae]|uniref:OmpA family protein n=1 Tax=Daejeonella oryzae TaxID=1122943 RepID=UPI00040D8E73|nr:OmpA family protein [Daejeonella oryzae]